MKTATMWVLALGLVSALGCSSSGSHNSGMMAMHCSKCSMDMKPEMTLMCKCGNEVKAGDLMVKCPKCPAEVKMSECTGSCPKCGASMNQDTCKVKCPKCGGEAQAKGMCCPHCMGDMKK